MAIDISTLPPMPEEAKRPTPDEVMGGVTPLQVSEIEPVVPSTLPPMPAATALPPMPKSPDEKRYWEIQAEKEKYGLLNVFSPEAIEERGGNILTSRSVPDEDVRAYAAHYGIDFDTARKLATLRGAAPPLSQIDSIGELIQTAAGKLNIATGNIAGWLGKKGLTDDPKMRAFLDDIGELADGRAGLAESVGGLLVPGVAITKIGKAGKLAQVAGAAVTGAGYGLTGSKEEQELEGIARGAVFGAALGSAATAAQKLLSRRGKMPAMDPETRANVEKAIDDYESKSGLDLTKETAKAYAEVKESNDLMRDSIVDGREISDADAKIIIEQQASPDTVELVKKSLADKYVKSLPAEEAAAAKRMIAEGKEPPSFETVLSDKAVADELIRLRKEEFVDELTSRTPEVKTIATEGGRPIAASTDVSLDLLKRGGPENVKREYDTWTAGEIARSKLREAGVRVDPNADALGKTVINFATDRMFGFKVLDEMYGGDTLKLFYQVNTNYNLFTAFKQKANTDIGKIFRLAKAEGLNKGKAMADFYQRLEAGQPLSAGEQKVADAMKDFFEKQREFFNTASGDGYSPMNIPFRPDFVAPQLMVRPVDYVIKMRKKFDEVQELIPGVDKMDRETFMREVNVNPALNELKAGIELVSKEPVTDGREMLLAFRDATQRGAGEPRLYRLASTTLPRKDAIPDFLREKNIFKLMTNYSEGTGRVFYLREPLAKLADRAKSLEAVKADDEARFVNRFIQDNLGIRQKSMARIGNQARIAFAEGLDNALKRVIKDDERREAVLDGFRFLPELAANLQYNIYPNVLALNPRAHMAQLTQVLFKTAPEVGGTYGVNLTMKATAKALLNLATPAGRREFYGRVKTLGLEPSGYVREAREAVAEGLEASLGHSVPAKAIRQVADAFMWTYGKMDTLNRAITTEVSSQIVKDLQSGSEAAIKAVKKMPVSVRREVVANMKDPAKQFQAIAVHLNAATQFNYNRASMSELGVTLGPLFSTFTKWPLAISGDILADMRTKGAFRSLPRVAEKYAAVFALASGMDSLLYSVLQDEGFTLQPEFKELSDRARKIVGAGGFKSMTPVASLAAFVPSRAANEKNLFTPPIVDSLWNGVLSPILDGDTEQLAKGGLKAIQTFGPGAFLNRTFMIDIPTLFGDGRRPEDWEEGIEFYKSL